jgi:hypothetical protein
MHLEEGASGPLARLAVISPDLARTDVGEWASEVVNGVVPLPDGSALVALSGAGTRIVLAHPEGRIDTRWKATEGSGRLVGHGAVAVYLFGRFGRPKSILEAPELRLISSRDAFATWADVDITADRVMSVCPTDEGVWMVSSAGHSLERLLLK